MEGSSSELERKVARLTRDSAEVRAENDRLTRDLGEARAKNARLLKEVQARDHELTEAFEQQVATSAILRVIATSPTDIQPVLDAVTESAARLCDAYDATLFLRRGDTLPVAARYGEAIPIDFTELPMHRGVVTARAILDRTPVHIHDLLAAGEEFAAGREYARRLGFRSILAAPLLRENEAIGALMIRRKEVRPFGDKQIELLKTFTDQAVIAIENARLFEQVQTRTAELSEALQQQTATADVLKVISRSAFDLDTVLSTLVQTAIQLCEATNGAIWLRRDAQLFLAAHAGVSERWVEHQERNPITPAADSTMVAGLAAFAGELINVADIPNDPRFRSLEVHKLGDYRGGLAVPLKREGRIEGVIGLSRLEARLFTPRQCELVQTFADQAVIAIENVRLFEEVQARTRDLTESLERQTATSEVLKVISRSAFDLQPVLEAIVETAARLCEAEYALVFKRHDGKYHVAAANNADADFVKYASEHPLGSARGSLIGRTAFEGRSVHLPDCLADPDYTALEYQKAGRFRTMLGVPLLRDGTTIGVIGLMRRVVKPFTDKQIELVTTFADQAVIAIENVRLFEEVQARNREVTVALEQQTATGEILGVIARSPTSAQPVFDTIAKSAARLCEANVCTVFRFDGALLQFVAQHGLTPEAHETIRSAFPMPPGRGSVAARAVLSSKVEQIPDMDGDPDYAVALTKTILRSTIGVPMLRDGLPIGAITIGRIETGHFPERQIELLKTFADQAVIAIENVRLFEEVQARNRALTQSLEQQTAMGEVLRVISRSPTDVQPVFDTISESAARLCQAKFCAVFRFDGELIHFMAQHGMSPEAAELQRRAFPSVPGRASTATRAILNGSVEQIPDVEADASFALGTLTKKLGVRSIMSVPMLRDGRPVGAISIARSKTGYFPDRQVELLRTFADQAVIAIENVRLFDEVQARTTELSEALQQQTATADVLKVISRSAFDLKMVLNTLAGSASRLCDADIVDFYRLSGDEFEWAASFNRNGEAEGDHITIRRRPGRGSASGRVLLERKTVHIPDFEADPEFTFVDVARKRGVRSILGVPLLREDTLVGLLLVLRKAPMPFTLKQIELAETFADQAVIAIENVRLFDEVQARTTELSEALQQQTATSDVLKVISRSTFDLQVVLDTLVESAVRLCRADKGGIVRSFDGVMRYVATFGYPEPVRAYFIAHPPAPGRGSAVGRVVEERRIVQIEDVTQDPDYRMTAVAEAGAIRTVLAVPLMRESELIGVFAMTRADVRRFNEKEIELARTFADQAVIAIENARLFEEVQAKTRDLEEALTFQKATGEVLEVIGRSASALQPVLDAIVDTAADLCWADMSFVRLLRDGALHIVASSKRNDPAIVSHSQNNPILPTDRSSVAGRVALEGRTIHIADIAADLEYSYLGPVVGSEIHSILGVPILQDGSVIGVIALLRRAVHPFSHRQVELVSTLADQAAIAIENTRLFEAVQARTAELSESLQQQTATADVLKVISRSAFDLQAVFETLIESAARLCAADRGVISVRDGDVFRVTAGYGQTPENFVYEQTHPHPIGRGTMHGRAALERATVHVPDVMLDAEYERHEAARLGNFRAVLAVPIRREREVVGVFGLAREAPGPFAPRQIELVETFADQAAIAIENARLFEEVQARTAELTRSLEELRAAQDRLIQTEKLASLGQLTAGIAHEIKNPLNFVNNFSMLSAELVEELREALKAAGMQDRAQAEIGEITDLLKGNLEKVVQHGRRADSIVKNMLLHSRQGSGDHRPVDINAVVEESLNLAYHGARAERQGFNITLEKSLDPNAGEVDLYPQEITRVLLNLISNGFYATSKRKAASDGAAYEPTLTAATKSLGDSVEIRIRDNGTGIPADVKEKMFNPFFTTKPAGEGTGLGLSLSHDIIVKQHSGTIEVDTVPGAFTEFRIVLPRTSASLGQGGHA